MEDILMDWFPSNRIVAAMVSIVLNILLAITGFLPSTVITIATVGIFGFQVALIILIIGEALGAVISFYLYRKGVQTWTKRRKEEKEKHRLLLKLRNTDRKTAFFLIIILRVLPFVPSGAITLSAVFSKISLITFSVASTLGKIPALVIEAYSISQVLALQIEWQMGILFVILFFLILYLIGRRVKERSSM